jgi:hypothetical protein
VAFALFFIVITFHLSHFIFHVCRMESATLVGLLTSDWCTPLKIHSIARHSESRIFLYYFFLLASFWEHPVIFHFWWQIDMPR